MNILLNLLFLVVVFGGGIALQIFLSRRKNKWLGLVLPLLCLLVSLLAVFSIAVYTGGELTMQEIATDGTIVHEEIIEQQKQPIAMTGNSIIQMIIVFLLYNIPTVILLIIYFACREQVKKNSQLEKMNIQDLE